jgi:hypothetical protein
VKDNQKILGNLDPTEKLTLFKIQDFAPKATEPTDDNQ